MAAGGRPKRSKAKPPPRGRPVDDVDRYAREVVAGKRPAGQHQIQACRRHLTDLKRQRSADFPYQYDAAAAAATFEFFQYCRHSKGDWSGLPFVLSAWDRFIVGSIFGWTHMANGTRRFRKVYAQMPRKQGKSTKAAPIAIRMTFFDGEAGAEGYCAATKKDQARIVFGEARRMVLQSPDVRLNGGISALTSNLHNDSTASKLEPLGADEDTMDGLNVHCAIIDELHAHRSRGVVDVIETAMGSRRQPLLFMITTPGFDRQSVCYELYQYSCQVLDGTVVDETWFTFMADPDEGDDWRNPRTWAKSNPGLGQVGQWLWDGLSVDAALARRNELYGRLLEECDGQELLARRRLATTLENTVVLDDLADLATQAQASPAKQNSFRRLRLGEWTQQAVRAIPLELWDACKGPRSWQELKQSFDGRRGVAGLDLASTRDIAAVAFWLEIDAQQGCYDIVVLLFMPEERLATRQEQQRIQSFAAAGALELTPGNVIDYGVIRERLIEIREQMADLKEIGFDPWNARQFAQELQDEHGFVMIEIRQGVQSMGEPTKRFLDDVSAGRIRHGGQPALRWMASNFATKEDSLGNLTPDKKAAAEKIDGLVAAIIARACLSAKPTTGGKKMSVYATRGAPTVTASGISYPGQAPAPPEPGPGTPGEADS